MVEIDHDKAWNNHKPWSKLDKNRGNEKNRWTASSKLPHTLTQDWEIVGITPLLSKLSFVGK